MRTHTKILVFGLLLTVLITVTRSLIADALQNNDCPVCFSIVDKIRADMENGTKTVDEISSSFLHLCDTASKESTDSKFCYYLGGQDVSATRTYKKMAERLSMGFPTEKVCEYLKHDDPQICEIREKKPIDLKTVDLKKLKVAELKRVLKERNVVCEGCFEKSEFIKKVEEIKSREEL